MQCRRLEPHWSVFTINLFLSWMQALAGQAIRSCWQAHPHDGHLSTPVRWHEEEGEHDDQSCHHNLRKMPTSLHRNINPLMIVTTMSGVDERNSALQMQQTASLL